MGCRIHVNRHGNLTLRLHWHGRETWEGTGLKDTKGNRALVARIADAVTAEIKAKTFSRERYLYYFPNGQRAAQIRGELGLLTADASPTLATYIRQTWLPRLQVPLHRATYVRDARGLFDRYFMATLGPVKLGELTTAQIADCRAHWLGQGLSVKTMHNAIVGKLSKALSDAVRVDRLIDANPCDGLEWPRRSITPPDPLTIEERDAVLEHFCTKRPIYYPFIATLLLTGMRPGEAVGLRWNDIDVRRPRIQIRRSRVLGDESTPKTTGSERTITPVPELVAVLKALYPLHADAGTFVFVGRDGHPLNQARVNARQWQAALRALKIRARKMYACRHTFISIALSNNTNLKYLADYCGTSVAMIEKRYGKFVGAGDEQLSRLTGGESSDFGSRVTGQPKKAQSSRGRRKGE